MKFVSIVRGGCASFAFAASLIIPFPGQCVFAQAFTEVATPFPAMFAGSLAWGDYDNDGDLDLLLEGSTTSSLLTRIYRNDGNGVFVDINAGLIGLVGGSVAWGDYDNDGDLDVLLNGSADGGFPTTAIYRNEGGGVFSLLPAILLGTTTSAAVWFDYDDDGDLDILVTGQDQFGVLHVGLHRNDGNGVFTSVPTQLPAASYGSIACADYDKDGDQDVLMHGIAVDGGFCRLYRNDGHGVFQDVQVGFPWTSDGAVAWGDYDNDGDLDIVQTGTSSPTNVSKIWRNDGSNVFTDIGAGLREAWESYAAWGDFDNDGDLDLLHLGRDQPFASLRRNDGNGVFNLDVVSSLQQLFGRGAWGDFDHDGDLDFVIMGLDGGANRHTLLYRNNSGTTNRTPNAPTGLTAFVSSNEVQLAWAAATDLDQSGGLTYNLALGTASGGYDLVSPMANLSNGFRLIVAIGNTSSGLSWNITNLPGGTYFWSVQAIDNSYAGSAFAPEQSFHINAVPSISAIPDQTWRPGESNAPLAFVVGDLETPASNLVVTAVSSDTIFLPNANLLLSGSGSNRTLTIVPVPNQFGDSVVTVTVQDDDGLTARASFRVSVAGFSDLGLELPGYTTRPSVAWGDIDNDGDLDFYVAGNDGSDAFATSGALYRNLNGTYFVEITNTLPTGQQGDMAFGDFDSDGDLDVVIRAGTSQGVQVWRNNGSGAFSFVFQTEFMYEAAVAWGDYNNDGRPDLAAGGWNSTIMFTRLYENAVNGTFNNVLTLPGVERGDVNWGDYDNDGDLDLALVGRQASASYGCAVYRNDNGVLTNSGVAFPAGWMANDWGDFDNDGDLDLLFARYDDNFGNQFTAVYVNNGNGGLTDSGVRLPGLVNGSLQFGDYDNDGWLDILMTGASPSLGTNLTRVYRNNGNGTFTDTLSDLPAISNGRAAWGDFENDGDLDILLTGAADGLGLITRIYRNDINRPNPPPAVPISFTAHVTTNTVSLNWLPSSDSNQIAGLTYNLRVGREPGTGDVFSPMAAAFTGRRRLPQRGNTDLNSGWHLKNLAAGTYYWSVQAIDHGFAGSAFAPEKSFVITQPPRISSIPSQSLRVNTSSEPISFTVNDAETPVENLLLAAQSLDTNLIPAAGIVFGGSGTNRTVTLTPTPDRLGGATVIVTLTDAEGWSTNRAFSVNVFNSPPVISDITNQLVFPNSATAPLSFVVGDVETFASNLVLTASSSNTNLVSAQSVVFGGADSNRTVTVTVASNQVGSSTIAITVTDAHGASASDSFTVKVQEFTGVDAGFPAVNDSAAAWGDFNNDGRLDLLISGYASTVYLTRLYRNDGNGVFTNLEVGVPGMSEGSVAWGDYNNDGWLDFLVTGSTNGVVSGALTLLYRNNGDETFTAVNAGLPNVFQGTAELADLDNDGLADIVLTGSDFLGEVARVYRNNGNGSFSNLLAGLVAAHDGSVACGDFDEDGDLDLVLAGNTNSSSTTTTPVARIYRNNGNSTSSDIGAGLTGVYRSAAAWGDYDGDGKLDVLVVGETNPATYTCNIYRNAGGGAFASFSNGIPSVTFGTAAWGDHDNDGRLDVLIGGQMQSSQLGICRIYRNLFPATNTAPTAPTAPQFFVSGNTATFRWDAAGDKETATNALTYNLRLGTTPGGGEIMTPAAAADGTRRLAALGNVGQRKIWTLTNLPPAGTFYWAVQAIDASFAGSPFTAELMFVITGVPTVTVSGLDVLNPTAATASGFVDANGFDTAAYFEWGTTTNYGNSTTPTNLAASAASARVSAMLDGLTPFTRYHWRMVASNSAGASISSDQTFITPDVPLIASQFVTNVTSTRATLVATVNPRAAATMVYFDYGHTPGYGNRTVATNIGGGTNLVSAANLLASLDAGIVYFYRPAASNAVGMIYGTEASFATVAPPYFTSVAAETNGSFRLEFNGASNLTYEVQVSTNLVNWTILGPVTSGTNGLFQ